MAQGVTKYPLGYIKFGARITMITTWNPIDTAPKTLEYDMMISGVRYAAGPVIRVRSTLEGETDEENVHWSIIGTKPAHWFIYEAEPLGWQPTEWRALTEEEELELFGEPEPE